MVASRDFGLEGSDGLLHVDGLRGGTVTEIATFLRDLENAYNAIYFYNHSIARWEDRYRHYRRFGPPEVFFNVFEQPDNEFSATSIPSDVVFPECRLELKRISIQSPGFWEFVGSLNPLQQLREYLNDRHERRKDSDYRMMAEKERLKLENDLLQRQIVEKDLEILTRQAEMMERWGFRKRDIQQMAWARLGRPLSQLGQHQDSRLIGGAASQGTIDGTLP